MNCKSCGAVLQPNFTICSYCGNRNEIDLKGIHEFTVTIPKTERICPICHIKLQTIDINAGKEHFYIEQCSTCYGLFFDHGELNAILNATVNESIQINYSRINIIVKEYGFDDKVKYKRCPICREFMNRKNFGTQSGVIIDICKNHGIWLDGGELKKLLEWKKAGGMILYEENKAKNRMYEEKLEKHKKIEKDKLKSSSYAYNNHSFVNATISLNTLKTVILELFGID